jgi:Helix-turn-helix
MPLMCEPWTRRARRKRNPVPHRDTLLPRPTVTEHTQRDLAARIKRPHSFVGRMEAGERRVDVIDFIEIARVLGANPKELFGRLVD